jgi:hypothetical protein
MYDNYVTRKSHRMQRQMFEETCPSAHFMETALHPPKHEK